MADLALPLTVFFAVVKTNSWNSGNLYLIKVQSCHGVVVMHQFCKPEVPSSSLSKAL